MPPTKAPPTLASLVRDKLNVSHREAKALLAAGRVLLDGAVVFDPARRPPSGAAIEITDRAAPRTRRPITGPGFRVVHLDDYFVVVDKDSGIVTVPTAKENPQDPPLVARVVAALGVAGHKVTRGLWVVHRIDRGSSGLVLFARSAKASQALKAQFRARRPRREYLAWTEGIPHPAQGRLSHHLRDDEKTRKVHVVRAGPGTREAELHYAVEVATSRDPRRARVRVQLVTGRRNQIRTQFAACGWPLLGDRFYGARDPGPGRTALHAVRLGFEHPATGEPVLFESPIPADLEALDRRLFGQPQTGRE